MINEYNQTALDQIIKHYLKQSYMDWLVKIRCMCTFLRLLQTRLEKEEFEEELKELQDKMTSMKQQTPDPSHTQTLSQVQ